MRHLLLIRRAILSGMLVKTVYGMTPNRMRVKHHFTNECAEESGGLDLLAERTAGNTSVCLLNHSIIL